MTIYLDNAATSHPKPESVYRAVDSALRGAGSPGRGGHRLSLDANRIVFEARESLSRLFHVSDGSRFVFTPNATAGINQALFGLLAPGSRVVTTAMEHNAVVRPLHALQQRGVAVVKVAADRQGRIDAADFIAACGSEATTLAVLGHVSNVTGTIQPLEEIAGWCRSHGLPLLVDAAQSAGILPIDLSQTGIDLLAAPGHKGLLGPAGTGFLYVGEGVELRPVLYGGTGSHSSSPAMPDDIPERLESGTPNLPGIAGLGAGIDYLLAAGSGAIRSREIERMEQLIAGLRGIAGCMLYGPASARERGGVLSFNLSGRDPAEIGLRLDRDHAICVRVGLHCAPDAHRSIGTFPKGTVRVSPGPFTTPEEIDRFLAAIVEIAATP